MQIFKSKDHLFLKLFIFIFVSLSLVQTSYIPIHGYDAFWHLKMGLDFWESGLSPFVDHYSFTFNQQKISNVPLLFQSSLFLFVNLFGLENGFHNFSLFIFALFIIFLFFYCKQLQTPWYIILLIIPFTIYYLQLRANIRPELLSYPLIILSLILYTSLRNQFNSFGLLLIFILLVFWSNWHTPVFGYIVFFALFIDKFCDKIFKKDISFTWSFWFFWGIIIFSAGFINSEFEHFFFKTLSFSNNNWQLISEYLPGHDIYSSTAQVTLLWVSAIYLSLWFFYKKDFGLGIICLILAYQSFYMVRLVAATGIITSCLYLYAISRLNYKKTFLNLKIQIKLIIIVSLMLISLYNLDTLTKRITPIFTNTKSMDYKESLYPFDIVDYLQKYKTKGNIFNEMQFGGFLLYHLSPKFKIYIDGRTNILYPYDFFKEHYLMQFTGKGLKDKVKQYDINYAIFKIDMNKFFNIENSKIFKLDYIGEDFFLFSNEKKHFSKSSKLSLFPMCWDKKVIEQISSEIQLAKDIDLNNETRIGKLHKIIKMYSSTNDEINFINSIDITKLSTDSEKRTYGYIAIKSNQFKIADQLFSSIKIKIIRDLLMMLHSSIELKKDKETKNILTLLTSEDSLKLLGYKTFKPIEKAILLTFINRAEEQVEFSKKINNSISLLRSSFNQKKYPFEYPVKSLFNKDYCHSLFN